MPDDDIPKDPDTPIPTQNENKIEKRSEHSKESDDRGATPPRRDRD